MKIPDILYNPNQEDQSIKGYIRAYDDYISIINRDIQMSKLFNSRKNVLEALDICIKINISLRMIYILEKYCEEQCEIKII